MPGIFMLILRPGVNRDIVIGVGAGGFCAGGGDICQGQQDLAFRCYIHGYHSFRFEYTIYPLKDIFI